MSRWFVDQERHAITATGIVTPSPAFKDNPETGRKQRIEGRQKAARDGTPLWNVEVTMRELSYGDLKTKIAEVSVPSRQVPEVGANQPIRFEDLEVVLGNGNEYLNANGIADAADPLQALIEKSDE